MFSTGLEVGERVLVSGCPSCCGIYVKVHLVHCLETAPSQTRPPGSERSFSKPTGKHGPGETNRRNSVEASGNGVAVGSSSGSDLQVCLPKGPTCCTRRMEERYQAAAKQSMELSMQASSTELKSLIIQNAALFQDAFDVVVRHARNYTALLFRGQWAGLAGEAWGPVTQLFKDVSLYILGLDTSVDDMVNSFFDSLFPAVYRRLLSGTAGGSGDQPSEECLRTMRRDTGAFGPLPKLIMTRMSRSLLAARVFLQALNLGIEVVNTTDHLRFSKDCGRALLRLWYCPHCQGLLEARPCLGFCQAVMQGCLLQLSEVQPYWQGYIEGLAGLAGGMQGVYDLENVLLKLHTLVRGAVLHAHRNRLRLATLLLQRVSAPRRRVKARPAGGELEEEALESGDCDDEDECSGSGQGGAPPYRRRLRIFTDTPPRLQSLEKGLY
ncbi:UNVERIFIED_CONTAM: hypothetical protein FKN15_004943 [Acipenser sinensis]